MPHLPAAYNLARWLLRDDQNADDVVQEAYLRAFRFFKDLRGESARPWLLGIVRNTCFDWMRQHRHLDGQLAFDEFGDHLEHAEGTAARMAPADPATLYAQHSQSRRVNAAIAALAPALREMIVLRELEEMSYEDMARVVGVPIGTVMSRLSRARAALRELLKNEAPFETQANPHERARNGQS